MFLPKLRAIISIKTSSQIIIVKVKQVKKQHLPSKICAACQRPFTWRKKWQRDWESVKYCSEACRSGKR